MKRFKFCTTVALIVVACLVSRLTEAAECDFGISPWELVKEGDQTLPGGKLLQVWELANSEIFHSQGLPNHKSLQQFQASIATSVPSVRQEYLLANALSGADQSKPDTQNAAQVLARLPELVRPARCLETLLLGEQTNRLDMVKLPSEFTAFVLESRQSPAIKIYYFTTNEPGIRKLGTVTDLVKQDVASGNWDLRRNIHNHNFFLERKLPLGGTVAPSATDVDFFRNLQTELGLKEAWITNGFDTLVLSTEDFLKFQPPSRPKTQ